MRKIFLFASLLTTLYVFGQTENVTGSTVQPGIPVSLLTDDSTWWTTSTLSALGYVSTANSSAYANYKDAGGRVAKFKFTNGNRFRFVLYEQANSYGTETETWTEVEGTVEFTNDEKGQDIFITKAESGSSRVLKNGRMTKRKMRTNELRTQYSNTYLWESITFPGNSSRTCLLMVDLDEHPQASCKSPGSIDRSWVSAFHIPAKEKNFLSAN